MGIVSLALAAAFVPGAVEMLQPSTEWTVDYADHSCTLSRSFGTGDNLVSLGLMPQTGGERVRIVLVSKNRDRFVRSGPASIIMGEGVEPATARYSSVVDPERGRVALIRTSRELLAPLARTRTLTLNLAGNTIALAVPQMGPALKALAACETDLAKSWGFDLSLIATPPVPIAFPQRWITNADYPPEALRLTLSGETGLRITVDASGKPVQCAVTDGSGSLSLDNRSCQLVMQRARFRPAMGKDGKPIAGLWATNFNWMLPGDPQ